MSRPAVMVVLVLLAAGCVDGAEPDDDTGQAPTTEPEAVAPGEAFGPDASGGTGPLEGKRMSWTRNGTGDEAFHFVLDLGLENSCNYQYGRGSAANDELRVIAYVNGLGGLIAPFGGHVAGNDVPGSGSSNNGGGWGNLLPEDGIFDAWWFFQGDGDVSWAAEFTMECDKRFQVTVNETATLYAMFDSMEMTGGVAAVAYGPGAAVAMTYEVAPLENATAWVHLPNFGHGEWVVDTPEASTRLAWTAPIGAGEIRFVEGGAGPWTFTLMEAQWWVDNAWSLVVGPFAPVDLKMQLT